MLPRLPRSPGYRPLWLAATISEFGDWSARLTLAALIFAATNNPAWVGLVSLVFILPRIGLGQVLTAWSERVPRKRLLVIGDTLRAVVFIVAALMELSPLPLLALVLVAAIIDPVFEANAAAATYDILSDEERDDGVRFKQVTRLVAQVGGMGAAGVALRWLSPETILIANAGSFAVSALIISGVALKRVDEPITTISKSFIEAARTVFDNTHIRAALITTTITVFAATAAEAQVVVLAGSQPSWVLPAASAAVPVGAATGVALVSTTGSTKRVLRRTLLITTLSALIAVLALNLDRPGTIVVAFACSGLMFQTAAVGQVIAVRHLPRYGRATILSLLQTIVVIGSATGAAISGFAMNLFGVRTGIQLCLAVAALAWLIPLPNDPPDVSPTTVT